MPVKIHTCEQRSPEWFELRKNKVTGSNAHVLLKKGLWEALDANSGKSGGTNYWMLRGQLLENDAVELYSKLYDRDVFVPGFVTNDKYHNAGASPDGIAGDILIEVKAFNSSKMLGIDLENIPLEVMAQLQFNMMICELDKADLVLYNPDLPLDQAFNVIRVNIDYGIVSNIESKLQEE